MDNIELPKLLFSIFFDLCPPCRLYLRSPSSIETMWRMMTCHPMRTWSHRSWTGSGAVVFSFTPSKINMLNPRMEVDGSDDLFVSIGWFLGEPAPAVNFPTGVWWDLILSPFRVIVTTLGPQKPWKMKVLGPKNMGYYPKRRFPWWKPGPIYIFSRFGDNEGIPPSICHDGILSRFVKTDQLFTPHFFFGGGSTDQWGSMSSVHFTPGWLFYIEDYTTQLYTYLANG